MNPLPPNADEIVSAYLDGEATPDEIVVVESNPELLSRVESMQLVAGRVGEPVVVPDSQKQAHLASAMAEFDSLFSTAETAGDSAAAAEPVTAEPAPVRSLDAARERRRPRRFGGVIAAAAAAMLLFVGLAALSIGRAGNSNDVASTASDTAEFSDAASDTSDADESASDDAMEEEAAVSADQGRGGLSELDAEPEALAAEAPAIEAMEEEAMEDQEAMVEEEAMVEDAMEEEAAEAGEEGGVDAAGSSAAPESSFGFEFFLGDFVDEASLRGELAASGADEFAFRAAVTDDGLFARCQAEIPELATQATRSLAGEATIAGELVEIHAIIGALDEEAVTLLIVDPQDCTVRATIANDP